MHKESLYNDYFNHSWLEWVSTKDVRVPFLHQELRTEWCVSTYKMGLIRMLDILRKVKAMGHPVLYVRIPIDEKMKKFEEMIGFTEYARDTESIYLFQRTNV